MTQLHAEHCEVTYEGAFVKPAFSLVDSSGKLCDLLLDALAAFGCTSADLVLEEGEPGELGVTCEVDGLDARVTIHGDRLTIHCQNFIAAASLTPALESVWSGLAGLGVGIVAKTHSFLFEADTRIRGASYRELLNRLAPAPQSLPDGTETAVVYYLPVDAGKSCGESSLVLNRSADVKPGLRIDATLVYEGSVKPGAAMSLARDRLDELLRNLGFEWIED